MKILDQCIINGNQFLNGIKYLDDSCHKFAMNSLSQCAFNTNVTLKLEYNEEENIHLKKLPLNSIYSGTFNVYAKYGMREDYNIKIPKEENILERITYEVKVEAKNDNKIFVKIKPIHTCIGNNCYN
jgi:hypothetical protein